MSPKKKKEYNRHHVNINRADGRAENIHAVTSLVHTQLHQQLQQITTELINAGIIGYDRKNPHYFIKDEAVREAVSKITKPEKEFNVEKTRREMGEALGTFAFAGLY